MIDLVAWVLFAAYPILFVSASLSQYGLVQREAEGRPFVALVAFLILTALNVGEVWAFFHLWSLR